MKIVVAVSRFGVQVCPNPSIIFVNMDIYVKEVNNFSWVFHSELNVGMTIIQVFHPINELFLTMFLDYQDVIEESFP